MKPNNWNNCESEAAIGRWPKILIDNGHGIETPGHHLRTDYTDGNPDMEADFYILRHTTAPAVLTENFVMDFHPDCTFLLSPESQDAIVSLHVTGITAYLSTL